MQNAPADAAVKVKHSRGVQNWLVLLMWYIGLHNLAENWSWALDVNGRDRDETKTLTIFLETRLRWDVTSRDRDVETETTTVPKWKLKPLKKYYKRICAKVVLRDSFLIGSGCNYM